MTYLNNYLQHLKDNNKAELAEAVYKTVEGIIPQYIKNFSYDSHEIGLLLGNIQSGKTSHMFGIINAAADEGFGIFILLTTDNILLQQQTYQRALSDFSGFCICDENDYIKFQENNMKEPSLIILKKNSSVLKQWKNNLSSTNFCKGNPIFIVDDEADAASLNTKVNQNKQSTINKHLEDIRKTSSSSIYLQVTGTPQSILLQTSFSGWHPYFIYYFEPGTKYIGGNNFFADVNENIVFTDNEEAQDIISDDEFPENGLKTALITHLITSAHIIGNGSKVCNFVIHPSVKTDQHSIFAEKIGEYLNELNLNFEEPDTQETLHNVYMSLKRTKSNLIPFEQAVNFIKNILENDEVKVLVLNSVSEFEDASQYAEGVNILVGGNSLGRGVTFPKLQTIYYCRVAKNPQADTMWQHSRMFGYDRDAELVRVFIPPKLFKIFSDINTTNNSLINQLQKTKDTSKLRMYYPKGINPTRKNVIDMRSVSLLSGGVNYFPFSPSNISINELDDILKPFGEEDCYSVSLHLIVRILKQITSETDDFKVNNFISFIETFLAEKPTSQGILIVRRERDIAKGTGTLLSPNDRSLGAEYKDQVVLTMYKVTGTKGWNGQKLWIPNIKLPGDTVYYNI